MGPCNARGSRCPVQCSDARRLCNDAGRRAPNKTSRMHLSRFAICVTLALGCSAVSAQQRSQQPSAPAVYTAEQAAAGEKVYFAQCAACHGDDLAGREKASALTGTQFQDAWNGKD